jgi:tetratricopeptide (TPR) repeat protein
MEWPEEKDTTLGTIMDMEQEEEAESLEAAIEEEEEEESLEVAMEAEEEEEPLEAVMEAEEEEEEPLAAAMEADEEVPGPEIPEIATPTLAELYVNQGQIESAIEIYRKILNRDPTDEGARNRLSELEDPGKEPEPVEAAPEEVQEADVADAETRKTERVISVLEDWLHRIQDSPPQASA